MCACQRRCGGSSTARRRHRRTPTERSRARRAIVAMPPTLTGGSPTTRRCPRSATGSRQRMAQGSVVKCMAIYPEPFWRADGLSGQVTSADGPVSVTFDNSPPDGSPGVLLAFLEGRAAREASGDAPGRAPRGVIGCLAPLLRRARRTPGALHRPCLGERGVLARLLRGLHAARRLDRERPGAARADRSGPLGRRRDGRRSGTATWTARSAPASEPPREAAEAIAGEPPSSRRRVHRRLSAPTESARSRPGPPISLSLPGPPIRRSRPLPPQRMSLPPQTPDHVVAAEAGDHVARAWSRAARFAGPVPIRVARRPPQRAFFLPPPLPPSARAASHDRGHRAGHVLSAVRVEAGAQTGRGQADVAGGAEQTAGTAVEGQGELGQRQVGQPVEDALQPYSCLRRRC